MVDMTLSCSLVMRLTSLVVLPVMEKGTGCSSNKGCVRDAMLLATWISTGLLWYKASEIAWSICSYAPEMALTVVCKSIGQQALSGRQG